MWCIRLVHLIEDVRNVSHFDSLPQFGIGCAERPLQSVAQTPPSPLNLSDGVKIGKTKAVSSRVAFKSVKRLVELLLYCSRPTTLHGLVLTMLDTLLTRIE